MPATRLPTIGGDLGAWGTVLNSYLSDRATAMFFDAVGDYGADPTGVADSTTAVQAAITAAIAYSSTGRGVVAIRPGTYKISSTLTAATASKPIYIVGVDPQSCIFAYTGSGDCVRMTNSGGGAGAEPGGGGIVGIGIDGVNASAGAVGLHFGDFDDARVDVKVYRFHGAGSIGILLENTVWWTEHNFFKLHVWDCTQGVVLKVSGTGTNSFGYNTFDVRLNQNASQDGFVVNDGCVLYHAALRIRANFNGSNSTATAVNFGILRVGTGAGGAHINQCLLEIFGETATWTFPPFSINFGLPGTDTILGCTGIIDLTSGGNLYTPSNYTPSTDNKSAFVFSGMIRGDINLCPASNVYFAPFFFTDIGVRVGGKGLIAVNGKVYALLGDFFGPLTLTGNITITLTPDGQSALAGPQRKTIVIKQAAGGGFTVAWPSTGAPTLAAPTVKWAGGAPTMSAGANAIDVYDLSTTDGLTWYGRASQNVT